MQVLQAKENRLLQIYQLLPSRVLGVLLVRARHCLEKNGLGAPATGHFKLKMDVVPREDIIVSSKQTWYPLNKTL